MIDKEYFLYKIASGKLKIKGLTIINPSIDLMFEACDIYKKTYESSDLLTEKEMFSRLIDVGYITEEEINYKPNENLKIDLFNAAHQTINRKAIREIIRQEENKYNELYNKKYRYLNYTKEGVATYAKSRFIIKNTTYKNKKRYNWSKYSIDTILSYKNQNFVSEKDMRHISRNDPWVEIWMCGAKTSSFFFAKDAMKLTKDQKRLIMWSSLYENIRSSKDKPENFIIDDDDMLDGWLLSKRGVENKKDYKDGQEIFIKVDTPEDAKKIEEMNSFESKMIKKSRERKIEKDGLVFEQNLPDVKRNIKMQINRG